MAAEGGNDPPNVRTDSENGLEDFITAQISEQRANQNTSNDNIDDEKMNRFLSRALSESRRMNQEVEKSKTKLSRLHEELGAERMAAWRQEHAAQVLQPKQAALVEMAAEKN